MEPPFLVGETIYLRPLPDSDADGTYPSCLNDGVVCQGNSHHRYPYSRESALNYIRESAKRRDQIVLAIVLRDGDRHVGNISLKRIDSVSRSAEFTILLGEKECWGKGFGTEAGRLLVEHAFFALNLHRIHCGTFSTNVGMQRLAKALGMEQEGCRRQAVFKDGHWLDVVEYGVLRDEYIARFGAPSAPDS